MTPDDRQAVRDQLVQHEGIRLRVYTDSKGIATIGVGRNLRDKGITSDEAQMLLDHDIDECLADLQRFGWFALLDPVRLRAVIDLRFNVGPYKLLLFPKFLTAMQGKDYDTAANELIASAWYGQVGVRGPRIVAQIRTGKAA